MTVINKSALVRFPARLMYELVEDCASYPQFLPWCQSSRVISQLDNVVVAELEIARAGFHKAFTTRNTHTAPEEIRISLVEGPFAHLEGVWRFTPLRDDASKISLELEFEMSSALANLAFGAIFNQICNTMVDAFCERAKAVYEYSHKEDAD